MQALLGAHRILNVSRIRFKKDLQEVGYVGIDRIECHLQALLGAHRTLHVSRIRLKKDLQEVGYVGIDWRELAQDKDRRWAPVNVVMKLRVP